VVRDGWFVSALRTSDAGNLLIMVVCLLVTILVFMIWQQLAWQRRVVFPDQGAARAQQ
jgi:hypothetical protein